MEQVLLNKKRGGSITSTFVTDILLLGIIYLLPTISHLLAFPLYLLDPMRIVIFASILLSCNKYNSFILAATIPLFSFFVGGHPVFVKSVVIAVELLVNVMLFWNLIHRWKNIFLVTLVSIFISKLVYYALKYYLIEIGWIQMDLLSTPIFMQFFVTLIISVVVYLFSKAGVIGYNNSYFR